MLDAWDGAVLNELDTEANGTLCVGQEMPDFLRQRHRCRWRKTQTSILMATLISGAAMSKKWSQLSIPLGDVKPSAAHVFGRLVEIRAGIVVYSTENVSTCQNPLHARKSLWEDVGAPMEKQRFGSRSSARLPPKASRIRRMFQVFGMDSSPVPSGSSRLLCELRPSWQTEGQEATCAACFRDFHISCNQQLETMNGSRCAAEACLHRIWRLDKPMPTVPLCMQDSGFFCRGCRFTFSESSFNISLAPMVPIVFRCLRNRSVFFVNNRRKTTKSTTHQHGALPPHHHHQNESRDLCHSCIVCAAHAFQLVLAFEITPSAIRSISTGCGSSDLFSHTAVVCAAGLGHSALGPCGCVALSTALAVFYGDGLSLCRALPLWSC